LLDAEELENAVEHSGHIRSISVADVPDELHEKLEGLGFRKIPLDSWMAAPRKETPEAHLENAKRKLSKAQECREIPDLVIIDPGKKVTFYKERWVSELKKSGFFIGRRPKAYGAALWCFVELKDGQPCRFIDLPTGGSSAGGCDEAWRLQAAVDHMNGQPQQFRGRPAPDGSTCLDFYSPVPRWAKRRWSALGVNVPPGQGALFTYKFENHEIDDELEFITGQLWLSEAT
jgi:hypothetical protein